MERREFLKRILMASGAAALAGIDPPARAQGDGAKSRVVVVRSLAMEQVTDPAAFAKLVIRMVHEAVCTLVGGGIAKEQAWPQFLHEGETVGVKMNCIAPPMCPHPAILEAVGEGAGFCGIPAEHVIGFDKEDRDLERSGFTINKTGPGVRCYGTVCRPPATGSPGYETETTFRRDTAYRLSRIVSRQVKALVNVPVIKDHSFAGISCSLKNHFGCIDNPNEFHYRNCCNPHIIDVNHDQNIKGKQRLILCDARAIQYEGGPSFKAECLQPYYAILAATDPVALDTIAMQIISMAREKRGLEKLEDRKNKPLHIAEGAKQNLGTDDLSRIEVVAKEL